MIYALWYITKDDSCGTGWRRHDACLGHVFPCTCQPQGDDAAARSCIELASSGVGNTTVSCGKQLLWHGLQCSGYQERGEGGAGRYAMRSDCDCDCDWYTTTKLGIEFAKSQQFCLNHRSGPSMLVFGGDSLPMTLSARLGPLLCTLYML